MVMKAGCQAAVMVALAAGFGCSGAKGESSSSAKAPPGPSALSVSTARMNGQTLLAPDAALAIAAGAGPLHVVGAEIASEGDRVGGFVEIPADECLIAYARPSPTIGDVDLFAYEDDGAPFSSDESPNQGGTILVCPPHPRRLYVVARVMAGTGLLAVGVQSVKATKGEAVAAAVRAKGRPGEDTGRLDAWPGLEAKLRDHRAAVGGKWEDVRRIALPVSSRATSHISVPLSEGRCADVLLVPSEEISSLDAVIEDPLGRVVARAKERGRERSAVVCTGAPTEVSVAVRPRGAEGLVAIVIGRSLKGASVEVLQTTFVNQVGATEELGKARDTLDRALTAKGYVGRKLAATGAGRTGQRASVAVDVPAGCGRVEVISGKPLGAFKAELWDDGGALVTHAYGGLSATFFACGKGGSWRVDVEALDVPGPFAVEVRKESAPAAVLTAHPAAAARLLGRLIAEGAPVNAASAADAQVVGVDASALRTTAFSVPANACVDVVAALDAGAQGIDMRLVDGTTQESSLVRGGNVAMDRLCAGGAPKPGKIELRVTTGKGDALVLTRVSPP